MNSDIKRNQLRIPMLYLAIDSRRCHLVGTTKHELDQTGQYHSVSCMVSCLKSCFSGSVGSPQNESCANSEQVLANLGFLIWRVSVSLKSWCCLRKSSVGWSCRSNLEGKNLKQSDFEFTSPSAKLAPLPSLITQLTDSQSSSKSNPSMTTPKCLVD